MHHCTTTPLHHTPLQTTTHHHTAPPHHTTHHHTAPHRTPPLTPTPHHHTVLLHGTTPPQRTTTCHATPRHYTTPHNHPSMAMVATHPPSLPLTCLLGGPGQATNPPTFPPSDLPPRRAGPSRRLSDGSSVVKLADADVTGHTSQGRDPKASSSQALDPKSSAPTSLLPCGSSGCTPPPRRGNADAGSSGGAAGSMLVRALPWKLARESEGGMEGTWINEWHAL